MTAGLERKDHHDIIIDVIMTTYSTEEHLTFFLQLRSSTTRFLPTVSTSSLSLSPSTAPSRNTYCHPPNRHPLESGTDTISPIPRCHLAGGGSALTWHSLSLPPVPTHRGDDHVAGSCVQVAGGVGGGDAAPHLHATWQTVGGGGVMSAVAPRKEGSEQLLKNGFMRAEGLRVDSVDDPPRPFTCHLPPYGIQKP